MTNVSNICSFLENIAPIRFKMDFDNVGLLVGVPEQVVTSALIALDITPQVVSEAADKGCQLIISHHPVIFHPLKKITADEPTGSLIMDMIRYNISAICMHTNLDCAPGGVNDMLADALGLEVTDILDICGTDSEIGHWGLGRIGFLNSPMSIENFCLHVKTALNCNGLRYTSANRKVSKVAVGGGKCGDFLKDAAAAECDTFVTADLSYNDFLDAKDININIIDAGHFPTENVVCPMLLRKLSSKFPEIDFSISEMHSEIVSYM